MKAARQPGKRLWVKKKSGYAALTNSQDKVEDDIEQQESYERMNMLLREREEKLRRQKAEIDLKGMTDAIDGDNRKI